jgi:CRP/FNR family transcriptional regulator, anaerobic regulatory protein
MLELESYITTYFGVSKPDVPKISSFFRPTTLEKGEYFLKSGKVCNRLSFQSSGIIRVYSRTEDKEVTQWISTKGYFLTDLSGIIFKTPSRYDIQALTDVELYTIHQQDYDEIGRLIPEWHYLEKLLIAKCFTFMEDRIFVLLSMTAEERYNWLFQQNKELFNIVPLQYLASMLGMTPETLSRIRKKRLE